ncbi:MAG TPA: suppressor of fused domain protein [Longimicrobium sp.]|nr:suppressor of fused domain protein [Longimicrobium sp.]
MDPLVDAHIRDFFQGHPIREHQWPEGPALRALPSLRVLEIGPGPRMSGLTTYVTRGAWAANAEAPLEFLMLTGTPDARYVELLTMLAFYGIQERLGVGHVVPLGGPLVPGSQCTCLYTSLPYTYGPGLEILELPGGGHLHLLWAMPITEAERALARREGPDALEEAFEGEEVEYWNPHRLSLRAASARA